MALFFRCPIGGPGVESNGVGGSGVRHRTASTGTSAKADVKDRPVCSEDCKALRAQQAVVCKREIGPMNMIIGACVVLFGGVVLTDPERPPARPYQQPAASAAPAATRGAHPGRWGSAYGQGVQPVGPNRFMPMAPTDSVGGPGGAMEASPFLSPTDQPGALGGPGGLGTGTFSDQPLAGSPGSLGGQQGGFGIPGISPRQAMPLPSRRPGSVSRRPSGYGSRQPPRSYAEYRIQQTQFTPSGSYGLGAGAPAASHPSSAGSARKPFSGYKTRPAVSPYMGLFRRNSLNEGDNYSTNVQPRLNQQKRNVMVGGELRSLQNRSQSHGRSTQQIGGQTRALQGGSNHSYFMNRGSYYPGSRK